MKRGVPCRGTRRDAGYLVVLFFIIVAFVGVLSAMQVLVLTSVATTSRAFDGYRQQATELIRLKRVVEEAVSNQCNASGEAAEGSLRDAVEARLRELAPDAATVATVSVPSDLPRLHAFPSFDASPAGLAPLGADVEALLTPELARMVGSRAATSAEMEFRFSTQRTVLASAQTSEARVVARLVAAPLTRFPLAAYELPSDIAQPGTAAAVTPRSSLPAGLVPDRDPGFVRDVQASRQTLPYHFRHRATLATAYQFVFSQEYIDRVAEYAGVTHFCDLGASTGTSALAGLSKSGSEATWDLGVAGEGRFGTVSAERDAAVVYTEQSGVTLRLRDTVGAQRAAGLLLLLLGPSDVARGPLVVELETIVRPVVIIAYHVRIVAGAGVALNGALVLDPRSEVVAAGAITVGHASFWAATTRVPENALVAGPIAEAAHAIAPRVTYVAAAADRP